MPGLLGLPLWPGRSPGTLFAGLKAMERSWDEGRDAWSTTRAGRSAVGGQGRTS